MNLKICLCLFSLLSFALAFPGDGWKAKLSEIKARAAAPIGSIEDSNEMLGDLVSPGPTSPVGQMIADIIVGKVDGQGTDGNYAAPGQLGSPQCSQDACCVFKYAADEMAAKFKGDSGRCNLYARGAIRLGFHDAATWKKGMMSGGADGSMILTDEISRDINRGLEEIVDQMRAWYQKYQPYGAGAADLIQLGATVATVVCPLGPRVRFFAGRQDSNELPPDGLLPDVNATVDSIIQLFEDKTIKPNGLAALVGAHTTSQQRFFQPAKAFDPQDSTPGVWDVLFYGQTLANNPPNRVVKFTSDVSLSTHPRIRDEWQAFTDPKTGQDHWNDDFAKEYVRLSMLGVRNINALTECTTVLPPMTGRNFMPPDTSQINQWLMGGFSNYGSTFGQLVDGGRPVTPGSLSSNGINPADANNRQPPPPGSPYNRPPPAPAPVQIPPPKPAAPSHAPPRSPSRSPSSGLSPPSSSTSLQQLPQGTPSPSTTTVSGTSSTFISRSSTNLLSTSTSTSSSRRQSRTTLISTTTQITQQTNTQTTSTSGRLTQPRGGTTTTTDPRQTSTTTSGLPGFSSIPRGGQNPFSSSQLPQSSRTRPQPTTPLGAQTTSKQIPTLAPTKTPSQITSIPRGPSRSSNSIPVPISQPTSRSRPTDNPQQTREPKASMLPKPSPQSSQSLRSGSSPRPQPQPQPQPRPVQQPQPEPKPAQQSQPKLAPQPRPKQTGALI